MPGNSWVLRLRAGRIPTRRPDTWRHILNATISKLIFATLVAILALAQVGCSKSAEETSATNPALDTPVPPGMVRGTVVETMNSGGYTYVLLDTGTEQLWMAGMESAVEAGHVVETAQGMPMQQFTSKTLNRTFDVLYFVDGFRNLSVPAMPAGHDAGGMPAGHPNVGLPQGHPDTGGVGNTADVDTAVEAVEAGKDIAWVYANKDTLAGQQVSLRGKVVKYNEGILGWNFLHVQDGSGDAADGSNDMIVTTKAQSAVGQTVVLNGTVLLDKDFGAGYSYPVLIEDAKLTIE